MVLLTSTLFLTVNQALADGEQPGCQGKAEALEQLIDSYHLPQSHAIDCLARNLTTPLGDKAFKVARQLEAQRTRSPQQKLEKYREELRDYQSSNNLVGQVRTLNKIGDSYISLENISLENPSLKNPLGIENYRQALDSYKQALEPLRKEPLLDSKEPSLKALTLSNIAYTYRLLDDKEQALSFYTQALPLWRAARQHQDEANLSYGTSNSGEVSMFRNPRWGIIAKSDENPRVGEAMTLLNIGEIYRLLGDYPQALYSLKEAKLQWEVLKKRQEYGKRKALVLDLFEARILRTIYAVYFDLGQEDQGLDYKNLAQQELEAFLNAIIRDSWVDATLGGLLSDLRDKDLTEKLYEEMLGLWQGSQEKSQKIKFYILNEFSNVCANLERSEQKQKALDCLEEALGSWQAWADQQKQPESPYSRLHVVRQQIELLYLISKVRFDLGEKEKASESLDQAWKLWQASKAENSPRLFPFYKEADILNFRGYVYKDLKQYPQALQYFKQALQLYQKQHLKDLSREAEVYFRIALVERELNNLMGAKASIEEALKRIKVKQPNFTNEEEINYFGIRVEDFESESPKPSVRQQRITISSPEQLISTPNQEPSNYKSYIDLASYFSSKQNYYEFYIDLLIQLHQQSSLQEGSRLSFEANEKSRVRSLLAFLNQTKLNSQGEAQAPNPSNPNGVELTKLLPEIQQQVLDEDTLLLQYALGEKRSHLWAVTQTGIARYDLPSRKEIKTVAQEFREYLTDPKFRYIDQPEPGKKLSQMILGDVASQLGNKRLLIAADGYLNYIPFSALPIPQAGNVTNGASEAAPLMLENHEIVTIPSASTLALLRQKTANRSSPTKTLAVFANPVFSRDNADQADQIYPPLPGTATQAEQILKFVSAPEQLKRLVQFDANRQEVFNPEISKYRILHFATHGILDANHPERSGMILSTINARGELQRGLLSTPDVFNLKLSSDLIVLSGCKTKLGTEIRGEGLVGLTSGFMTAGAKRVVASLWSVEDEATTELMKRFYREMFEKKRNPSAALTEAQRSMLKDPKWKTAYNWAAFTLQGEWRDIERR